MGYKHKRSSTAGKVPSAGDFEDGEILVNTADGRAFIKAGSSVKTIPNTGDLAAVATSGKYSDLSGRPSLGSAASAASDSFATAAQGTKADSAVQPSGLKEIGVGQTWKDVSSSRNMDATVYTNNTGKPISVVVQANHSSGTSMTVKVNGVFVFTSVSVSNQDPLALTFIVPVGATYYVEAWNGADYGLPNFRFWKELS